MTTKEAIKQIKKVGDYIAQSNAWDIRDELYKCCDKLEEELQILEILKNRISLKEDTIKGAHFTINEIGLPEIETDTTKDYDVAFIETSGFVFKNSEEYKLLKWWLKNDQG